MAHLVHFYLQAKKGLHLIVARSARNGKIVLRSTGLEIDPAAWDRKAQEPIDNKRLRNKLVNLRTDLERHWRESKDPDVTFDEVWDQVVNKKPSGATGSVFVTESIDMYAKNKRGNYADQFKQVRLAIEQFKPRLKFKDFNADVLNNYFDFLRTKKQGRHKSKTGITEATINIHRVILKMVAEFARKRGYPVHNDIFEMKIEKVLNKQGIVLTFDELLTLRDFKGYTDNEQRAVDLFLFEAFTGIRHGDIGRLVNASVQHTEELGYHLQFIDTKTTQYRYVTLHNLNKPIVDKYWQGTPDRKLFPPIAAVNRLLKSAAKKAGLNRLHNEIPGQLMRPVYDAISTHDGRHTYASLLKNLLPMHYVVAEIGWRIPGSLITSVYGIDVRQRVAAIREVVNALMPAKSKLIKMVI